MTRTSNTHVLLVTLFAVLACHQFSVAQWAQTAGPQGGTVNCLYATASGIFAGTSGGVYVSRNGGADWSPSNSGLSNRSVNSIAKTATSLFCGTDIGLFKSTDDGLSWSPVGSGITSVTVLVADQGKLFVGEQGGLQYSTDDGASWSPQKYSTQYSMTSIASRGQTVFAGWRYQSSGTGVYGGLSRSTDGGLTWTTVISLDKFKIYTSIIFRDSLVIASNTPLSGNGIIVSADTGSTWSLRNTGLTGNNTVGPLFATGQYVYAGAQAGVYRSTNNGINWTPAGSGVANLKINAFAQSGTTLFLGADYAGIYLSSNDGGVWNPPNSGLTDAYVQVLTSDNTNLWASMYGNGVSVSTDGGGSWGPVAVPMRDNPVPSFAFSGGYVIAGSQSGVFRSGNRGATWDSVAGLPSVSKVVANGPNVFAGSSLHGVWRSTNSGLSWAEASQGLIDSTITAMSFSGTYLYAGTSNGNVFLSTNNGALWTSVRTGLPTTTVSSLASNASTVYAGHYDGTLYVSTNSGSNWTNVAPYLGGGNWVSDLLVRGQYVYASIFTAGIFQSTDNGGSWRSITEGLTDTVIYALAAVGKNLFVGTRFTSVWRQTLLYIEVPDSPIATPATVLSTTGFMANWKSVPGATGYRIDVATDTNFTTFALGYSNSYAGNQSSTPVTGLNPGFTYYYRIRGTNSTGPGGNSNTIKVQTLPIAPIALAASNVSDSGFVANWGTSGSAAGYRLDVATDTSFIQPVSGYVNRPVAGTSQNVSGLNPGRTYYYRVRAENSSGVSANSSLTAVTLIPPAPFALLPSAMSPTGFTANWNPSTGATGYRFDVARDTGFFQPVSGYTDLGVSGLNQIVSGLTPGSNYYYRVRAGNGSGVSKNSNVVSTVTTPSAPGATAPTLISSIDFTANWNSSTGATGYRLDVAKDTGFIQLVAGYSNLAVSGLNQLVTGLSSGTPYYYRVRGENASGSGPNSNSIRAVTIPVAPLARDATGITQTQFTANWDSSTGATGYRLDVATDPGFSQTLGSYTNLAVSGLNKLVSALTPSKTYYYHVRAEGISGTSSNSNAITVPTLGAPGVPTATTATGVTTIGFIANWTAPVSGANSYQLDVAIDTGFTQILSGYNSLALAGLSQLVSGLNAGTLYYYRVRGVSSGVASGNSNTAAIATLPLAPVALPPAIVSTTGFSAHWVAAIGATGYRLDIVTDTLGMTFIPGYNQNDVGNFTTYEVSGLLLNSNYYYRVRAYDIGGSGGPSNWVHVATLSTALPPAPVATAGTYLTSTSFSANWTSVYGATGYLLDVATNSNFTVYVPGDNLKDVGSVTTSPVLGLAPNTTYYYRVWAYSPGGRSLDCSDTISVTTPVILLSHTVQFPSKGPLTSYAPTDYRIVGIPGNSGKDISTFLQGNWRDNWEVYWDNGKHGNPTDYFDEYKSGSATFVCSTGRAFWVLTRSDLLLTGSVNTASFDTSHQVTIPLSNGISAWQLITNPYEVGIPWGSIAALNGIGDSITSWDGTRQGVSSLFDPYKGYLFFNGSNSASIRIPYSLTLSKGTPKVLADDGGWRIGVVVRSGKYSDETTFLGVTGNRSNGGQVYQQHKPRSFGSLPAAYFDRPDRDAQFSEFATDIRSGLGDIETWEMKVRSDEKKPVTLEFTGIQLVPQEQAIALIDESDLRAVDLRKESVYPLQPASPVSVIKVVIGQPDLVKKMVDEVAPKIYALLQNYPNPFNPTTTIPVVIPRESRIVVEIYNILGQHIRTMLDGDILPGQYYLMWDGRGDSGSRVSSGIYFCRMSVPGTTHKIIKLNLIK